MQAGRSCIPSMDVAETTDVRIRARRPDPPDNIAPAQKRRPGKSAFIELSAPAENVRGVGSEPDANYPGRYARMVVTNGRESFIEAQVQFRAFSVDLRKRRSGKVLAIQESPQRCTIRHAVDSLGGGSLS